ncbi:MULTISPECIES: DUF4158 domain-containing protein [Saccharomonospora]|jgi:hypothetical protein|uniref:Uncharacterized protein n=3 Tax=Saccharomonospora TaxID=1851 RepID=I1D4K0_9PSEU|nr:MULTISPECIES: hypothetical protein [Saccharomonospora]EHR61523.1 hypothetical protein SaccyDRAFT_2668 [Saccharomonospora cyanea NA-134]EHY87419.1 hypothetical protein SacazDRAFT_00450 [Saccharomonospora azurea NA-128]EIE99874.1 hypothetical protein SacglDRAFT_03005 [Saccharomonospora glauca K62]
MHVAVAGFRSGRRGRVAVQLGVPIADLAGYGAQKQTRAGRTEWKDLEEFLLARVVEHDAPSVLFRLGYPCYCVDHRATPPWMPKHSGIGESVC